VLRQSEVQAEAQTPSLSATLEMLCKEDDLDLIKDLDSVKSILEKLKAKYKGDITVEFFTLQTKWEKLAKESGETISEFFCSAKDIANRLKVLEQPITEPAIIAKLMSCLPSDYDLVIALFKERSSTLTKYSMSLTAFQQSMQKREAEIGLHSVGRKTDKALQARAVDNEEDSKKQPWWEKKRGGGRRPRGRGGIGSGVAVVVEVTITIEVAEVVEFRSTGAEAEVTCIREGASNKLRSLRGSATIVANTGIRSLNAGNSVSG
jgi:hypothetical protein